ncbi:DUF5133 domain-containing protein [Streptomyces sp. NPDC054842]
MLHPAGQGDLVERYDTPRVPHAGSGGPGVRRRMDGPAYARCVATGTGEVDAALLAVRHRTPGAGTSVGSAPMR